MNTSSNKRFAHPDDDKMGKPYLHMRQISWSLLLRRLLLKVFLYRRTILRVSASYACLVFFLSASKATRRNTFRSKRSISHQYLIQYPRSIQYDGHNDQPQHTLSTIHGRIINEWTEEDEEHQKKLFDDNYFDRAWVQPFTGYEEQPHCQPMHEWQLHHSPTCNLLHEYSLRRDETYKYLSSGWYRSTFEINDATMTSEKDRNIPTPIAMKTMKLKDVFFIPNLLDRHRVDALIYETTTASKYILDIYAYCAFSGLYQFAAGGTLMDDTLQTNGSSWLRKEKLETAIEVVSSIADLHTIPSKEGFAAMSHTDIMLDQWLWTDEGYKLNDFNRGHLMYWNEEKRESCPYLWNENNPGYVSFFINKYHAFWQGRFLI